MRSSHSTTIDDVREFWDRRPCNIRHSSKPVGSRAYFDEVQARKYFVEPHIPAFAQFDRWEGKRILEVGCGIGTDTVNFARAGAQVTAVDVSEKSLVIAQQRARVYGLSNIRFFHGNAEELGSFLPLETYDLIYSFGVLHHTPQPERAMDQLRMYCRPGTVLKVMVYNRYSWKALEILLWEGHGTFWNFSELLQRHSEAQTGSPVTYSYTRRSIRKILRGFVIDSLQVEHIFPYRISDYVQYQYRKVWYFRAMPEPAFRWLANHFGWHLCVTAHVPPDVSSGAHTAC
jgi:2-polyprenyl-3-methyl-5-hydroxy-6-metoxy-1,4-benzoquinol methylase